jgi:O-antigen biosynthesis protein
MHSAMKLSKKIDKLKRSQTEFLEQASVSARFEFAYFQERLTTAYNLFQQDGFGFIKSKVAIRVKRLLKKSLGIGSNSGAVQIQRSPNLQPVIIEPPEQPITVSIIIPIFNQLSYTHHCLVALRENVLVVSDRAKSIEIIVIDDASTDKTAAYLQQTQGIRVITNPTNLGFIRSCNTGAAAAQGEFLYFLNNDTQVMPGGLESLLSAIELHDKVGIIGSKLVYANGKLQEAGGIIWQDAAGWNYGRNDWPHLPKYNYVRDVDYCSGASLLVRRDLFFALGQFSETFIPAYYEDTDLCFGARELGYRVLYQPQSVVVHHEGVSSGTSLSSGIKSYQAVNHTKFQQKWQYDLTQQFANDASHVEEASRRLANKTTILIIDSYVPLYDQESGSYRLLNIIKILLELNYFVIFLPDDGIFREPYTVELQQLGVEVLYHLLPPEHGLPQLQPTLYQFRDYLPLIDIAWVCRPELCRKYINLLRIKPEIKVIYDTVDLHFVRLKRQYELARQAQMLTKPVTTKTWQQAEALETKLARQADLTLVVTSVEKEILGQYQINTVGVIPNIHPLYTGSITAYEQRANLLFIGGYNHPPNVDAVLWLCQEIMPLVWQAQPEMQLTLLGSHPTVEVLALAADPRIHVTGYLKDVESFFLNHRVFVSPLRFGAGMKGKIGQSLSYGLPVISTSIGVEGMDLKHQFDAMIADDAQPFAELILKLYQDPQLWQQLSQNSLESVQRFGATAVRSQLKTLLENLVCNH